MIKYLTGEKFKEIEVDKRLRLRYAISNFGRLVSFNEKINEGRIVNGSKTDGYRIFRYKINHRGRILHKHLFFYRMVAENFLKQKSDKHIFILHLDRKRSNDKFSNLQWATREQMLLHNSKSPYVIAARKKLIKHNLESDGHKLTIVQVQRLKKLLADPKRRTSLKSLAQKFQISEMQLYRIKRGENWSHIKV